MIGQQTLWRTRLPATSTSWRVGWRTAPGEPWSSGPIRQLALAAARAAAVAEQHGQAWLIDAAGNTVRVAADGELDQSSGWAAVAARVINQRRIPSP